jgi:hypothetical protein
MQMRAAEATSGSGLQESPYRQDVAQSSQAAVVSEVHAELAVRQSERTAADEAYDQYLSDFMHDTIKETSAKCL